MHVRPRRPDDLPALVEILTRTHRDVGYPLRAGNVRAAWLAEARELGAWVADDGGRPAGHVALHPSSGPSSALWRTATGRDDSGLAVVSRLLSDLRGAGSALLARAEQEAAALGRVPVLEVELGSAARVFYLRRGWTQGVEVGQRWGEHDVRVAVLVGGAAVGSPAVAEDRPRPSAADRTLPARPRPSAADRTLPRPAAPIPGGSSGSPAAQRG